MLAPGTDANHRMPGADAAPVRRLARRGPGRPAVIRDQRTADMVADLLAKGWTFAEIARVVRCSSATIARWVRDQERAPGP